MNHLPDIFRRNRSLFADFFRDLEDVIGAGSSIMHPIAFDISERDDAYIVSMDVPGFKPQDLKIDLSGNVLTVTGEHSEKHGEESKQIFERRYGKIQRSLTLPSTVAAEAISAHCEDGVLEIMIPKQAEGGRRAIEIQAGRLSLAGETETKTPASAKNKEKSDAAKH